MGSHLMLMVHYIYEHGTLHLLKIMPQRVPGLQIPIRFRVYGNQFTTPIDFIRLFFSF